jgi:hypothetical protein
MKHNFTFRLYKDETCNPVLSGINEITISGITVVSKPSKFGEVCLHKGNKNKFKYSIKLSKEFHKVSGSNSTPLLTFSGEYLDIHISNFPRFPAFYQCKYAARNIMNGCGHNDVNNGFPKKLRYRKIDFITSK